MNTLFTKNNLLAVILTVSSATSPMLGQSKRPALPVKQPITTTRPASSRPAGQPTATAKPVATQAPAQPASSSALATATSAPVPTNRRVATAPVGTAPAKPAKTLAGTRYKYLNAGIGLAAYYGGGLPIGMSFEVTTKNRNISVGGSVDYFRYGYNSGGYKWNYTFVYAGARASYHLGELLDVQTDKFDPYVGATLGLRYAGYKDTYGYDNYASPYNSGLFLGIHLGSRYMFSEKVGGFAEVGYGVSALRLGVAAKF
jgi:hypothetical protein